MKEKFTQKQFVALPRDEHGIKLCPTGDYSAIREFGEFCSFGEDCSFEKFCSFGRACSFGEDCSFGRACSFGEDCSFGRACSFGEFCSFGEDCSFGEYPPPPTQLLLCNWGRVSDELCTELMKYDAANHPNPVKFQEWADGGDCPFKAGFPRVAHFEECKKCWKPGPAKSARELVLMLFKEKNIKHNDNL